MSSLFRNNKDFSYGTVIRKVDGIIMVVLGIVMIIFFVFLKNEFYRIMDKRKLL